MRLATALPFRKSIAAYRIPKKNVDQNNQNPIEEKENRNVDTSICVYLLSRIQKAKIVPY